MISYGLLSIRLWVLHIDYDFHSPVYSDLWFIMIAIFYITNHGKYTLRVKSVIIIKKTMKLTVKITISSSRLNIEPWMTLCENNITFLKIVLWEWFDLHASPRMYACACAYACACMRVREEEQVIQNLLLLLARGI